MLKVTKLSDNRVDLELDGVLDAATMRDALDQLVTQTEGMEAGRMLYTIRDFAMPTIGALGVEFGYLPKLFSLIGKVKKVAVLTDIAWVRGAAEVEGALIPGTEINAYGLDARDEAEAWLMA